MAEKPKPDPRAELVARRGEFVRIVGGPVAIGYEQGDGPRHNDHLWITIRAGPYGRMRIAINTFSVINFEGGFDPHVRLGIVRSTYDGLPEKGVFECDGFDYAQIEKDYPVDYENCNQRRVEALLNERANTAFLIEAWGDLYARHHAGLHQVHSRRASCAVQKDIIGRDGALRFYFDRDTVCETLLFKFCGQP